MLQTSSLDGSKWKGEDKTFIKLKNIQSNIDYQIY